MGAWRDEHHVFMTLRLHTTSLKMEPESVTLNLLAEKVVHPAIKPEYMAYCPTMDLIALATTDEQVHVHRLNGQKIFGATTKQSLVKINSLRWKPNGKT